MKTAFLILGAQRSGTSATSHLLSQFGVNFGDRNHFLQDNHNPIFFELKWVNQYNNRLTQALGYQYIDFFLPIESDYETEPVNTITAELPGFIQQEWQDADVIGIKDPRFSLTFPVWQKALSVLGYTIKPILVFRSPAGFLRSNQKLFDQWPGWDQSRHLRFWLQFNLAAIYFTRNYPTCWVDYDQMVQQPLNTAQQLADSLNLNKACVAAAAAVVDCHCQHHRQWTETGDSICDRTYQQLRSQQLSAEDYLKYRQQSLVSC